MLSESWRGSRPFKLPPSPSSPSRRGPYKPCSHRDGPVNCVGPESPEMANGSSIFKTFIYICIGKWFCEFYTNKKRFNVLFFPIFVEVSVLWRQSWLTILCALQTIQLSAFEQFLNSFPHETIRMTNKPLDLAPETENAFIYQSECDLQGPFPPSRLSDSWMSSESKSSSDNFRDLPCSFLDGSIFSTGRVFSWPRFMTTKRNPDFCKFSGSGKGAELEPLDLVNPYLPD